jgi:hypothetical protein
MQVVAGSCDRHLKLALPHFSARLLKAVLTMLAASACCAALSQAQAPNRAPLNSAEVFEWAERVYPELFPGHSATQTLAPFRYRYYAATDTYLALDGTTIQALAPWTNGQVSTLGRTADFACAIDTRRCGASHADGRSWRAPHRVDEGNGEVIDVMAALDDSGRATVVMRKQESERVVLYARQGRAGSIIEPAHWDSWAAIDVGPVGPIQSSGASVNRNVILSKSPAGHAVVAWLHRRACTPTTYLRSGTCDYIYTARRMAGSQNWETPVLVADTPGNLQSIRINDRGDILVRVDGWKRNGQSFYTRRHAVAWRPASAAAFTVQLLPDNNLDSGWQIALDNEGRFVLAGEATQSGTTDLAVYRGRVGGTIGSQEVIDQRGAAVTFRGLAMGTRGGSVVVWDQNNGTRLTRWAAVSSSGDAPYAVTDFGQGPSSNFSGVAWVAFSDHDVVHAYDFTRNEVRRWAEGVWSSAQRLPADFDPPDGRTADMDRAINRNGDVLSVRRGIGSEAGTWSLFDASRHKVTKRFAEVEPADYVVGLSHGNRNLGQTEMGLALNAQALVLFRNRYDVMPAPGMPAGDARTAISRVWVSVLR